LLTVLLQEAQLGGFFFAAAGEARFLQLQIADLLFVDEEGMRVDQERAGSELVLFEQIGEFDAAFGEERHFQSRDTAQASPGIGDGLDELTFTETHRLKLLLEGVQMALVFSGIVAG